MPEDRMAPHGRAAVGGDHSWVHALPEEVSSFVGREEELARLGGLLGEARLVTVVGTGGVGKTRLALRAAARAATSFDDGTCLVQLSALRSPGLVPDTVADCLGLPGQDGRQRLDAVLGYLRDRRLLLVLDTCEHLIEACALLAEAVLSAAAGVTILATSRQPFGLPGESVYELAPLPVPEPGAASSRGDAVELLAQRASAVVPGFSITSANQPDAVRLAVRLGGVPLAIELAAVCLRAFPLAELADRLEGRQPLTGARRDSVSRHRTLGAAIGWSYDLCTPAERELWARLSVFAGPFGAGEAARVCADDSLGATEVAAAIAGLADKSVLTRVPGPASRYRMLDTIRDFGAERLAASGAEQAVRDRHLSYYLGLATQFDASPLTGQLAAYQALRASHADLRAALGYAFSLPPPADAGARLATSLLWYWQISGLLHEGREWLGQAIERVTGKPAELAAALLARGYLAAYQGKAAAALVDIQAGLEACDQVSGEQAVWLRARGQTVRCRALISAGSFAAAAAAADEAVAILDELATADGKEAGTDPGLRLLLTTHQAYLDLLTGDLAGCVARSAAGLVLAHPEDGERWTSSYLQGLTGLALFLSGRKEEGNAATLAGLAMRRELQDTVGTAYGLGVAAIVAAGQGRHGRAAWLLGAADPLWDQAGAVFGGTPAMQDLLGGAVDAARQALGDGTFTRLRGDGARTPLESAFERAVADADEFTPPRPEQRPALTRREREVAALVAEGLTNQAIAQRLFLSKRTVDSHIEHIYSKVEISSRGQLVSWLHGQPPGAGRQRQGR